MKICLVFAIPPGIPLPKAGFMVLVYGNDGATLTLLQLHLLLVQILAFSSEMGKGLINYSVVHCMAPLEPSQGEEGCVAHLKKCRSAALPICF